MKNLIKIIALLTIFSAAFLSCEKKKDPKSVTGVVEMYLLDEFETLDMSCQIDENTIITEEMPLISYDDFISYNSQKYCFIISEEANAAIDSLEHSVVGLAFAVTAGKELIYTGYFWPAYSSLSCNWVIIDPIMKDLYNGLKVELGYPGENLDDPIPDRRNDSRILDIFRRDNKLVE